MSVSMDESLVQDEDALSDYDMALNLLKNNPPENRLDIPLSYSQYLKLEECWSNIKSVRGISEDQSDCGDEVAASELRREIMNGVDAYLSIHKPEPIGTIMDSGSTKEKIYEGAYIHSQSTAVKDFARAIMVVIEVASSETYAALCRDKNMWLDGHHVKVCILIYFKESPRFRNPSSHTQNMNPHERLRSRYGPISYRNHNWLEVLKEGFIEVWCDNGSVRYPLIEPGKSCDPLPTNISLRIREFAPNEAWDAANIPDGDIILTAMVHALH
ncbi:hypothetical protein V1517DRAFT_365922 [Lipomyces orientalis]|uniref:Uncharacterized protein n=1 Tax=Lipomyces orientalis TaxID=1233043 RepID=A0ACC3TU69_9ASCO